MARNTIRLRRLWKTFTQCVLSTTRNERFVNYVILPRIPRNQTVCALQDYLANELQTAFDKFTNQARFVQMIVDNQLVISDTKKADIVADLRKHRFLPFSKSTAKAAGENELTVEVKEDSEAEAEEDSEVEEDSVVKMILDSEEESEVEEEPEVEEESEVERESEVEEADANGSMADFNYLLGMAILNLTKEKIAKLKQQAVEKEIELLALLEKSPEDLWNSDLNLFLQEWK